MKRSFYFLALFTMTLFFIQCSKDKSDVKEKSKPIIATNILKGATDSTGITWGTGIKVSHIAHNAEYGRMCRVDANTLLLSYSFGPYSWSDNITVRRSTDNGATWGNANTVVNGVGVPDYYGFSNPEIYKLNNGSILMAYIGRGNPDDNTHGNVQMKMSQDGGVTWGDSKIIATGRSWEPGIIQLPNNEIEIFYSSEAAWWPSANPLQEILMISSTDNGTTWTAPKTVAFAAGKRDGMPAPILLANSDVHGMGFAIESVNDNIAPFIIRSDLATRWNYPDLPSISNGRRWRASTKLTEFGGGPDLAQLSNGKTLLSYHCNGGRAITDWKKSTMQVMVGDADLKGFGAVTTPWPGLATNEGTFFNSMFVKDDNTVIAVCTRNYPDGHNEVWTKEGSFTSAGTPIVSGSTYKILSRSFGKAIEVAGSTTSDGGNIAQYDYVGRASQKWVVTSVGGVYFKFVNVLTGKCLDVSNGNTADGANIVQWTDNGNPAQKWAIVDLGNGYWALQNELCGKIVDLDLGLGSGSQNGNIRQETWKAGKNQQWQMVKL